MAQQSPPDPQTCTILYKILTPDEKDALPESDWAGTAFDQTDGFIHLSTSHQTPGTLQRFFAASSGVGDTLYLVALPRASIADAATRLKFEPAAGTLFGHVYGTLNPATDFAEEYKLERNADGLFDLPGLPF